MSATASEDRSRLLRALALSRRFHLFLAYVESPRAADQLLRMLEDELPRLRKAPVELVRLDPYEGRRSDAPLEDRELADGILIPLLSPSKERRAHGVVHVVDASRATPDDTEAWGRLFALWNEKRNALQQLGGEVLVVLPEGLKRSFATAAPDVWSIRSGEYTVEEETGWMHGPPPSRPTRGTEHTTEEAVMRPAMRPPMPRLLVEASRPPGVGHAAAELPPMPIVLRVAPPPPGVGRAPAAPQSMQSVSGGAPPSPGAGHAPEASPPMRGGRDTITEEPTAFEVLTVHESQPAVRREALGWYRAISPLSLFGGDLLVRPWLRDIVLDADVEELIREPVARRGGVLHERARGQRALHGAEHALGERRFEEASRALGPIAADLEQDPQIRARAATNFVVALAAQDRVEEALVAHRTMFAAAEKPGALMEARLGAEAYVNWCAGHLGDADAVDARRTETGAMDVELRARVLRLVERGDVSAAVIQAARLPKTSKSTSVEVWTRRTVLADLAFLGGNLREATNLAVNVKSFPHGTAMSRSHTLMAFVELARGDRAQAAHALRRATLSEGAIEARSLAFHAFVSALVEADGHDPQSAVTWLQRAHAHIAEWSHTGLDRRSLRRASFAVDLAHATLDPHPADPIGVARQLVQRSLALLGDTAEDFIARVLAVEARRELARRLAYRGDDAATAEACRALDLARPLAGRDIPAWDALVAATEREALSLSSQTR